MRPPQLTIATLAVSVLSAGCAGGNSAPLPEPPPATTMPPMPEGSVEVTVKEVKDGRTVLLSNGSQIRITGLAEPGACWTETGATFARTTLLDKTVRVTESAPDASPLWLADGTDYALLAVGAGVMRTDSADYPAFKQAEQSAADNALGLWGPPCNAQPAAVPPPATTATTPPPPAPAVALPAPKTPPRTPPKTQRPAATPAPPPPAPPAPPAPTYGCRVAYRVTNQWNGSFRTDVTITNTGSAPVNGWTLTWVFGAGQAVKEMWNATYRQSGGWVGATNVGYNPTIPPGGSLLIGFTATNGPNNPAPGGFSLNGRSCVAG